MFRHSMLAAALAVAGAFPALAQAQGNPELKEIREQVMRMKDEYESRIRALETRLQEAERRVQAMTPANGASAPPSVPTASAPPSVPTATAAPNAFNPAMSLTLAGSYARLSQDPNRYRLQGFLPSGDEVGPGARGFNLGESELTFATSIDPRFQGQMTFSVAQDNTVGLEEAFVRTQGLANGVNAMAGRFLSGIGYLNGQHAHAWDFVDAPLAYQAFFGGRYGNDGVQLKWLAPTDTFIELGVEAGRGASFPGTLRNRNGLGSTAAFVHAGGDIGDAASWRAGLSWLRTSADERAYDDVDASGAAVVNAFTGRSTTWIADAVFKWAPNGNSTQRNLKLQAEYFRRVDSGTLAYDTGSQAAGSGSAAGTGGAGGPIASAYRTAQSGFYVQGVYQFMPQWRFGARYDRLYSGTPSISAVNDGLLSAADFTRLLAYNPTRTTAMIDWSPSEFSRFRLQLARDRSRPDATDNQLFIQYIMSLGVHGAHAF